MDPSILARDDASGRPPIYKAIGISLAVASGLFIGVSFVIKKIGLLKANVKYNEEAGEGYGYLRNFWWWTGMTLMIVGEICNFVAYAFVDAILVTPLGALAVVVTTILSAIFLKERLSFVGKVGCFSCIIGSVVIAMNAPEQSSVSDIQDMKKYVITPGFLSYAGVIVLGCAFTAFWASPRYGKKNMFVYISICSLIGGLSVVATQGLGSAILAQINGKSQFKEWFLYVLLVFVIATLLTEIIYLNKALNIFNAALVTPTYYVFFTTCTIVTSAVLFQGFQGTGKEIATVVMGFLQICAGVVLLQLSKSAKDVPDAAVFKGDLDQVREVATQEESETEPKADSIRGAAAIVRQLSSTRRKGEEEEVRRYLRERNEDLKPLGENETVEWDGLRRRKTVLGDARSHTSGSAKSSLPPLGMSHFPEEQGQDTDRPNRSFIDGIRSRASSLLHPQWRPINDDQSALDEKSYHGTMPPDTTDFAYARSPTPQTTPQPVYSGGKRQFSFNIVLNRLKSRPSSPAHGILRATPTSAEKEALKNATEEERLGLVLGGDSHRPEDDELNERLARTDSVSSSDSSLGGGQAMMDRLHQSLDEATRIYQSPKPKQHQVSVSTVSTALGAPFEGNAVYPLSCSQPPSYTTLPQSEAVPSQQQPAQRSNPLPPVPPESPLVAAGGDSYMRVELRSPYSPPGSEVSSRGRGGWRREDY
ncbi:hypothetical protein SI65_03570 [Aspergillus cristatus]|uniref:Magnesium transporter NIPA2 n=1 Tax=Aspergillus cristatus TaxID=573508 RepID=A0A1E3BHX6_ASPCR|nr:hypothetical protein SI65_03570 [Aspergillus cristatus]